MMAAGQGQLVGQFLLDRDGVVRWTFTELAEGGRHMFGAPNAARTNVGGLAARALGRVHDAGIDDAGELTGRSLSMSDRVDVGPLQPGERAPNVVLDAITREGKIAIDDFRGQKPVLVGLFRGLHCPFCRRHIAASGAARSGLARARRRELDRGQHADRASAPLFALPPGCRCLPPPTPSEPRIGRSDFPISNSRKTKRAWPYKVSMAQASEHAGRTTGRASRTDGSDGGGRNPRQEGWL